MKKEGGKYFADLASDALWRAARGVAEDAKQKGIKIPIWRNGQMEYGLPTILDDGSQVAKTNSKDS